VATVSETVRRVLSDFNIDSSEGNDSSTLRSLGLRVDRVDSLEDAIQASLNENEGQDCIRDLEFVLTPRMTLGGLVHFCETYLDINEVDRLLRVMRELPFPGMPPSPEVPPLSVKLYDIGLNEGNHLTFVEMLRREFALYGGRLRISPNSISKKTTIAGLVAYLRDNYQAA